MRKRVLILGLLLIIFSIIDRGFLRNAMIPETEEKQASPSGRTDTSDLESVPVKRVIDGDTVELVDGRRVRYIGIDTPELSGTVECFGREAYEKNKELVEGKTVQMEKDVSETDRYGRLLRYVYVNNTMINELLVKEGYANASSYPPDVLYNEVFRQAERLARESGAGLWGAECY